MGQMGFFDLGNRYSGLDAKNEPLLKIDGVVPWEDLRARLEAVWRRADKARRGRDPQRAGQRVVALDHGGDLGRVHGRAKAFGIETDFGRDLQDRVLV